MTAVESDIPNGSTPLSEIKTELHARWLYEQVELLVHPPDSTERPSFIEATLTDFRSNAKVRESFIVRLRDGNSADVYTINFENDGVLTADRKVESSLLPGTDQPWEKMRLQKGGSNPRIVHQSRGIYSEEGEETKKLKEGNNTTDAARAEMLVRRLIRLWLSNQRGTTNTVLQTAEKVPQVDKTKDLYSQLEKLGDPHETSELMGFLGDEYYKDGSITAAFKAEGNGEYIDVYTVQVDRRTKIARLRRERRAAQSIEEVLLWEEFSTAVETSKVLHRSKGIKEYGEGTPKDPVVKMENNTTAQSRGEVLMERFKVGLNRCAPVGTPSRKAS